MGSLDSFGSGNLISDAENVLRSGETAVDAVTEYFSDPDAILSGVMVTLQRGVEQQMLKTLVGEFPEQTLKPLYRRYLIIRMYIWNA